MGHPGRGDAEQGDEENSHYLFRCEESHLKSSCGPYLEIARGLTLLLALGSDKPRGSRWPFVLVLVLVIVLDQSNRPRQRRHLDCQYD